MERYEFGNRVAQLRKVQGFTQAELAEKLDVSNKTISRWETGDGYPDISLLKPLANQLGVSIDYLLGNDIKKEQYVKDEATSTEELCFDWKHPRWNCLTTLNKVAAITFLINLACIILWWTFALLNNGAIMTMLVVINVLVIEFAPITGIICAVIGLIRGEKGLSRKQKKVSVTLIVLNLIVPIGLLLSSMFPLVS